MVTSAKFKTVLMDGKRHQRQKRYLSFACSLSGEKTLTLLEKAEEMNLTDFVKAIRTLKLTELFENGNFTMFVPVNGAFKFDNNFIDSGNGVVLKVCFGVCMEVYNYPCVHFLSIITHYKTNSDINLLVHFLYQ